MKKEIEKAVKLLTNLLLIKGCFYGKVQLNFQDGILVNANIEESVKLNDK